VVSIFINTQWQGKQDANNLKRIMRKSQAITKLSAENSLNNFSSIHKFEQLIYDFGILNGIAYFRKICR
jgi:hypothetical protein